MHLFPTHKFVQRATNIHTYLFPHAAVPRFPLCVSVTFCLGNKSLRFSSLWRRFFLSLFFPMSHAFGAESIVSNASDQMSRRRKTNQQLFTSFRPPLGLPSVNNSSRAISLAFSERQADDFFAAMSDKSGKPLVKSR